MAKSSTTPQSRPAEPDANAAFDVERFTLAIHEAERRRHEAQPIELEPFAIVAAQRVRDAHFEALYETLLEGGAFTKERFVRHLNVSLQRQLQVANGQLTITRHEE